MAAKLINMGGAPVNEGEAEAIYYLEQNLPANYLLYPNIELSPPHGNPLEYDAIVVAPHAVYAIEIKDWHGTIIGKELLPWSLGKSTRPNPVRSIHYKAKVLKGRITGQGAAYDHIWVEHLVLIVNNQTVLNLSGESGAKTMHLTKAINYITNPKKLNAPNPIADDAVKNSIDAVRQAIEGAGAKGRSAQPLRFNQYEVIETLDESEDLNEYLAVNTIITNAKKVRLRVYRFSPYMPKDEVKRRKEIITHEYKVAQEIGYHQNILPVRDILEADGDKIIEVTDWSDEGTLAGALVAQIPFTTRRKLEIVRELLFGLAALHRKHILHRAIHPSNIILSENYTPRLMNFDRARLNNPGVATQNYTVWQTPTDKEEIAYLAPELAQTNYKAYPSSDLYSLGIVAFELLSGIRPIDNPNDALKPNFPDVRVSEFVQGYPAWLDDFITKLLQGDVTRRFIDAEEALTEFDKQSQPEQAAQVSSSGSDGGQSLPFGGYKPNDVIDMQYRIVSELGRGGSSQVYKVYNYLQDRQFAMKIINIGVQLGKLQSEFSTLRSLSHPSIARAEWAAQTKQSQYYLVMELVEGEVLSNYISGNQRMSVSEAVELTIKLLDALEYLHTSQTNRQAILHRDIKPSNLMRTKDGIKIIDFNIATQAAHAHDTMVGTSGYVAPDMLTSGWDASCDLFATGIVLYQLVTRHHPYEGLDSIQVNSQPQDPRRFVENLSPTFAAFLMQACKPLRQHRFTEAATMCQALQNSKPYLQAVVNNDPAEGLAKLVRLEPSELDKPNYNPYVTRFLTLYSQARRSNRGTRGLDDIARATYVPTLLDRSLQPAILDGQYRLIIITGNAGDGKTAFIQNLESKVQEQGVTVTRLPHGNGSNFTYNQYSFVTNYDGSQDEGENVNDKVLKDFFASHAGNLPSHPSDEVRIIAINEGRLRDFLEIERDDFQWLRRHTLNFFDEVETVNLPEGLLIVNLNWRSVVAEGETSIFTRQLKVFADNSFWQPCEKCTIKDSCFIKFNIDTFRDVINGAEINERIRTIFETVHLRRRLHITMRDMRSALSYMIFRDHNCADVAQALDVSIVDPTVYLSNFYFNILGGQDAKEVQQIGKIEDDTIAEIETRGDRLVRLMTQVDVALVSNPQIDREMHFDGKTGGPPLFQLEKRSKVDEQMLEVLQNKLTFGYDIARDGQLITAHRVFHHMERRKAFFERRESGWLEMLPYVQIRRLREITQTDSTLGDRAKTLLDLKKEIIGGISASEGSKSRKRNREHIWLRASQADKPTIKSYRLFPEKEFELLIPEIGQLRQYLEYIPDHLVLRHKDPNSQVSLIISLDLLELLLGVSNGFKPSLNDLRGAYVNLTIFRNALLHLPFRQLILTENERDFFSLYADETNRVVLAKEEAI